MTAKEYLSQGRWLNQKILNRNDEIRQLRELAETIKATNYEQSIVQTSGKPDAVFATIVEKIADSESELSDEVERYLKFICRKERRDFCHRRESRDFREFTGNLDVCEPCPATGR